MRSTKRTYFFSTTRWFWDSYVSVKGAAILSFCVMVLYMLTNFAIIGVQKWIIDDVFMGQNYELLPLTLTIFAFGFISFAILNPVSAMIRNTVYNKLLLQLSTRYMNQIGHMPFQQYQKERTAQYVYHFSQDIRGLAEATTRDIPTALQQALYVILLMIVIGWISPFILLFILLFSVLYIILGRRFAPLMKKASERVQARKSELLVHIEEGISSTREVIAFHRLKWEKAIYDRLFGKYFDAVIEEGKLENKHLFLSDPMRWGANLVILAYGGYLVLSNQLSVGWLVVVYQFGSQLMEAMQLLFQLILGISGKTAFFDRINQVFQKGTNPAGTKLISEPIREISFKGVTFAYDNQNENVLNHVNLKITAGQKIAFVGTSGGGKSTLLQLLSKNYSPSSGKIIVNGQNELTEIADGSWFSRMQIVFQEPYIFQATVEENIRLGRENASQEELEHASQAAQIHEFITSLPQGYQTVIGERGMTLSGGQRQRIALARALLQSPDVLVLDEATSALDMETERKVQAGLDQLMSHKMMIVVAHRLSTIENADVIHVLDQGRIVESGTHRELLQKQGVYTQLYQKNRMQEQEKLG